MANKKVRLGLIGAKGQLGLAILEILPREFPDSVTLAATIDRDNASSFSATLDSVDVFLDNSTPSASEQFVTELLKSKFRTPYVIGCTGWTDTQLKIVHDYSKVAPVILAPNFAPSVNLLLGLIEKAAPLLSKWGYDVSVHETHHNKKRDIPSGTAKAIVERLGSLKPQVHATRAGNIVGTHEVRFIGPCDILSLTHEALDRSIFARGAVMAADWASRQTTPGMYSMKEVVFGVTF